MLKKSGNVSLSIAAGTVLTISLAPNAPVQAMENPFSMTSLGGDVIRLAEGKCGEGKCGGGMRSEGRCGMHRMDADGDGKVTREEFMKGHEVMFDRIDQNGDGVIDPDERAGHMKGKRGCMNKPGMRPAPASEE